MAVILLLVIQLYLEAAILLLAIICLSIVLLTINKRKYFKSTEWTTIIHTYSQTIRMVNALSECIRSSLKKYYFNINYNCSLSMFNQVEANPFIVICRLLNLEREKALEYFDELEQAYHVMHKEKALIKSKLQFVTKVKKQMPFWVRVCTFNDLYKHIEIDPMIDSIDYPSIRFTYCNPAGCCQTYNLVLNIFTIQHFKSFVQDHQEQHE